MDLSVGAEVEREVDGCILVTRCCLFFLSFLLFFFIHFTTGSARLLSVCVVST